MVFMIVVTNCGGPIEQLMALIGEQFGDSEDICGVVVSVRQWQDKLSLWTKTEANESVQVGCFSY